MPPWLKIEHRGKLQFPTLSLCRISCTLFPYFMLYFTVKLTNTFLVKIDIFEFLAADFLERLITFDYTTWTLSTYSEKIIRIFIHVLPVQWTDIKLWDFKIFVKINCNSLKIMIYIGSILQIYYVVLYTTDKMYILFCLAKYMYFFSVLYEGFCCEKNMFCFV